MRRSTDWPRLGRSDEAIRLESMWNAGLGIANLLCAYNVVSFLRNPGPHDFAAWPVAGSDARADSTDADDTQQLKRRIAELENQIALLHNEVAIQRRLISGSARRVTRHRQSLAMLGGVARSLAVDLRNQVTAVASSVEELANAETPQALETALGAIRQSSTRATAYAERLASEALDLVPVPSDPSQYASAARSLLGRVLVLDREPVVRQFVSRALRQSGYDVLEAPDIQTAKHIGSAAESLTAFVSEASQGEGLMSLVRGLRQRHREMRVLWLAETLTGRTIDSDAMGRHEVAFLPKPFGVGDLVGTLRQLLGRAESIEQSG